MSQAKDQMQWRSRQWQWLFELPECWRSSNWLHILESKLGIAFHISLRVSNHQIQVNSRECDTYFTVRGGQVGGRYSPYAPSQSVATRGQPLHLQSSNAASSAYVNVTGGYDCYNGLYGPGMTRTSYPAYSINYEDEMYNGQSPAYMLPSNNDNMLSSNNIFGSPASPRNWDVFSGSGRGQNALYSEQNPPSSVSHPSGSFPANGIPFSSNPNEISSSLSSSNPIATSMTSFDRTLPNPAVGRPQQPALMMAGTNSLDGLTMSNIGYRSSVPWLGSDSMSGSSQSSDRVMSVSYGSTMDSNGDSGDSSATTQEAPFTYGPTSHSSSPDASMKAVAATLPNPPPSQIVRKLDDSGLEHGTRTLSRESTASPEHSMAEAYSYSGDMVIGGRRPTHGSISSGTLSNGQTYTRVRPTIPTPTPELCRNSQHDSADYHAQIAHHRTSIASLSGAASY
jgi:hypothetical protein